MSNNSVKGYTVAYNKNASKSTLLIIIAIGLIVLSCVCMCVGIIYYSINY